MWKILEINYEKNILNSINSCELYKKKKKEVRALATRKSSIPKTLFLFFPHTPQHPIYISKHSISYKPPKTNKKGHKTCDPHNPFSLKKPKKKRYLPCFSHSLAHTHTFFFSWKHVKKAPLSSSFPRTFHLHLQPLGKQEANLSISLFKQNKIVNPLSLSRINIKTKK